MASIFLSYSREDAARADRIALALGEAGHDVWWDRQIGAGSRFSKEIDKALKGADLVVVLWSNASVESAWVQDEAADGRDSGRLVPVLIDPVSPPLGFRQFQAVHLASGLRGGKAVNPLLQAIAARMGSGGPAPAPSPAGRPGWRTLSRRGIGAVAAVVLIVAATVAIILLRPGRAEAEPATLAVLPFKNMSAGDPYFAEGIAEEIMSQLAREPQFKVAGRSSSALFKDAVDFRDVGRRLHVAYVLEGSVRSANKQVRVNVALVDASKGMRLWSENYRGTLDDIFAIQESVGRQVAEQLKRRLVRTAAIRGATTTRGDVYSLAVTARSLIRTREPVKLETAVELLERATKLDPNYAPAWARLAQAKRMSSFYGHRGEPRSSWVRPEEIKIAERAIALAPNLAEAHAVMGLLLARSGNSSDQMTRRGRAEIERAVQLDPSDAQNWYWLFLLRQEDDLDFEGALAAARKAAEIDPFFVMNHYYGELAWQLGEREESLQFLKNWIQNHPDSAERAKGLEWLASLRHDWSELYKLNKSERERTSSRAAGAETAMGMMLIRVGLVEESKRYLSADHIAMRLGNAPPPGELSKVEPLDFWFEAPVPLIGRLLINHKRAAELVSLYDRAFPSRGAMATLMDKTTFIERAPIAAAALREVGRTDDAQHLLDTANRLCAHAIRRGRTPVYFRVDCSRSWAMLGRGEAAIRILDQALKFGWRPESGWSYIFVDEPVYRAIRDDPRLKRLSQFVLAENARERRELLAAGV